MSYVVILGSVFNFQAVFIHLPAESGSFFICRRKNTKFYDFFVNIAKNNSDYKRLLFGAC